MWFTERNNVRLKGVFRRRPELQLAEREQDGRPRRSRVMNATFLHTDKALSHDEQVDAPPPACPGCGAPMWLARFTRRASDAGVTDVRSYECRTCGAVKDISAAPAAI